jgi:hypothetical protein
MGVIVAGSVLTMLVSNCTAEMSVVVLLLLPAGCAAAASAWGV